MSTSPTPLASALSPRAWKEGGRHGELTPGILGDGEREEMVRPCELLQRFGRLAGELRGEREREKGVDGFVT
jgi:hypothetical protein